MKSEIRWKCENGQKMSEKELSCVEFDLKVVFFLILFSLNFVFINKKTLESVDNNFK